MFIGLLTISLEVKIARLGLKLRLEKKVFAFLCSFDGSLRDFDRFPIQDNEFEISI